MFCFTQEEVFTALEEFQLAGQKDAVKQWYDGFTWFTEDYLQSMVHYKLSERKEVACLLGIYKFQ